jgi:uncharacterized protein
MKTILPSLLLPLLLVSCGNILSPVEDAAVHHLLSPAIPERRVTGSSPALAIASPALPGYLDRQQLVTRSGDGVLQMSSIHVWGENLGSGISRVMAINLGRLTNSLNIQPVGNFVTMDYDRLLEIRILRFEPDANHVLTFECTWKVQPVAGALAPTHSFLTEIPLPPGEAGAATQPGAQTARIRAMNEALARLSREIARKL